MKITNIIIFSIPFVLIFSQPAQSGGAAAQRQNMMRQQQQQMQQQQMMQQRAAQQAQQQRAAKMQAQKAVRGVQQAAVDEVKQIANFDQVIDSLNQSSQAWPLIIDDQAKELIVAEFIQKYRQQGMKITKSPLHYANLIDSMSQSSPEMLAQPFEQILMVVAVIEYDFNNGQNQDAMALKVLGSRKAVQENRSRLGLPLVAN